MACTPIFVSILPSRRHAYQAMRDRVRAVRFDVARVEREQSEKAGEVLEEDELHRESPNAAAARAQQFATIKELLTATELGTS